METCLNSRPLCPFSTDIDDLHALTSAHSLIGGAIASIPKVEPSDVSENRLSHYQFLMRLRNQFWKRWGPEYMQHLQKEGKWRGPTVNFKVGQLVIVQDDHFPPAKWSLSRVTTTHAGPDGHVRVVTVKTVINVIKRHVARLAPLFINEENTTSKNSE